MPCRAYLCITLLAVLPCVPQAQEAVWSYEPLGGYVDSSPAVADIDGDGLEDVIVTTTAGAIVALDGSGRQIWEQVVTGPITIPPSVARLGEDAGLAVLALNKAGSIFAFDAASGRPLWTADLPGSIEWGVTALVAADLDGDGGDEIIAGDSSGHVARLSGAGETAWNYAGSHGWSLCPAVADLDGDGIPEILIAGTDAPLLCLATDGKIRWAITDKTNGASPVVADLNADGTPEIVCGIGNDLALVDAKGAVAWRLPMTRPIDSAITVADVNQDGQLEIYAVDIGGILVCADAAGKELWREDVEERARRSPSVGDVDGDGAPEILVAGYSGAIHVFTSDGTLKVRVPLQAATNATATFLTLQNGTPAIVAPTVAGTVKVLQWPGAAAGAKPLWSQYRGNAARTASTVEVRRNEKAATVTVNFGRLYAGTNSIEALVTNPEGLSLEVRLEGRVGDGPASATTSHTNESACTSELPYLIPTDRAVNVELMCTVTNADRIIAHREKRAFVAPFQKELADASQTVSSINHTLTALPDVSTPRYEATFLDGQLSSYQERAAAAGAAGEMERRELRDALHAYIRSLQSLNALVNAAAATRGVGGATVAISAANPWAPFGGMDEVIENRLRAGDLAVAGFVGETESAACNIFNFSDTAKTFRVLTDPVAREGAEPVAAHEVLELREAVDVPTDVLNLAADALPALNQASLITVPAWQARQLWVSVNTTKLTAGVWGSAVRLKSLDVSPVELVAPIAIQVWPQAMPEDHPLRFCHWGYVESSFLKDQPQAALDDQVSHHSSVFVSLQYPKATFDEQGALVGEIDFTAHDDYVKQHSPHGIILFCGYQGALQGPGGVDSEAYGKAHIQWLRQWVAHLKEMGIGYEKWALYPVDEPGLTDGLVEAYLRMAKLAREADPQIQMYTDPVGRITMDQLKTMAPYVDIWCPNRNGFLLDTNSDMFAFIKSTGKTVWTYECDGNAKHQSPLGYYRGLAWLAWHHELTGIGFWTYCTSPYDPWYRPEKQFDYLLIYQGHGVVPSKRWEAVRDGIEDYSMLLALQSAADAAEREGKTPEAVAKARALLDEGATGIAQFCGLDEAGTLPGKDGEPGVRTTTDARWNAIQTFRADLAITLATLTASE